MTELEGYEPQALAEASILIGSEGIPYPPMPAPPYRFNDNTSGSWRFTQQFLIAAPGYFTGPRPLTWMTAALVRDGVTWMSLVPMEVESQMPHLAAAHGTVVVCGMGLGLMAYAVSARKAVDKVIVVERDPTVIAMFKQFAEFQCWPQRNKVEIVNADAMEVKIDGVDFLYADIWPRYRMDCMITDTKRMFHNIPAKTCGYWGQELDMVDFALAQGVKLEEFSAAHVQAFADHHGLPLIGLEEPRYAELCRIAAANPAIGPGRVPV